MSQHTRGGAGTRRGRCDMSERVMTILAGPSRKLPDRRAHEVFEHQARARPDAIATVHGSRQHTYGEVNARANKVARALLARGLTREGVAGVATERNLDWMTAVLAIFKAGGAYLPIEPHFPAQRVATTPSRAACRLPPTEPGSTAMPDPAVCPPPRQNRRFEDRRRNRGGPNGAAVLRHLIVATDCGASGRWAHPDLRAGADPRREALHRQNRRRTGQCRTSRAVLPRSPRVLSGPAPKRVQGSGVRRGHGRSPQEGAGRALVRGPAPHQAGERLWTHRDLGRHQPRDHGPRAAWRTRSVGPPHQQCAHLRRRRTIATGATWRAR